MFKVNMTVRWSDDYIEGRHTDQERARLCKERGTIQAIDTSNRTVLVLWGSGYTETCMVSDIKIY